MQRLFATTRVHVAAGILFTLPSQRHAPAPAKNRSDLAMHRMRLRLVGARSFRPAPHSAQRRGSVTESGAEKNRGAMLSHLQHQTTLNQPVADLFNTASRGRFPDPQSILPKGHTANTIQANAFDDAIND